jgi:hypothetical protein
MNTISDLRPLRAEWSPVAETMLWQMSPADQAVIHDAIDHLTHDFDPSRLTLIEPRRDTEKPFYVLPVEQRLLVFLEQSAPGHFRILDVLTPRQLDAWRATPRTGAEHN